MSDHPGGTSAGILLSVARQRYPYSHLLYFLTEIFHLLTPILFCSLAVNSHLLMQCLEWNSFLPLQNFMTVFQPIKMLSLPYTSLPHYALPGVTEHFSFNSYFVRTCVESDSSLDLSTTVTLDPKFIRFEIFNCIPDWSIGKRLVSLNSWTVVLDKWLKL